ncbi:MAG: Flp pilus assembly complex ATPase component TadA [Desulfurococcaceae archaeon]|nr:Flp pilus assembly complex ATPase component TadA [Desulfurococcaceae archaeon]
MEILLSYSVGLASVSIVRTPGGNYQYVVTDIDPEKYEAVAKYVGKAVETLDPRGRVGLYEVTKALLQYLKSYDPELVAYVVSRELKYKKLQVLIDDPYVEDISINGPGTVWVRHRYVLEIDPSADYVETNIVVSSYEELMSYAELLAERAGRVINRRVPIMDFTLPEEDGGHRVHIVLPDVAYGMGEIVIRKKARYSLTSLEDLVKEGMVSEAVAELLKLAIRMGGSIMVIGPPGSGKTTLLKALLNSAIPRSWKIAIIEDTPEIDIPKGASWVRYVVPTDVWGSERGVDQMALAKAALRASVSRFLVIGETRGAEAKVLAQAMNMGLGGLCLPGDQLVLAKVDGKVGLYEIGDLVEGVIEGRFGGVEVISVDSKQGPEWVPVSRVVIKAGSSRFVRIVPEVGPPHEVHEDHPLLVLEGGQLKTKRATEVRPGDVLLSVGDLPHIGPPRGFVNLLEVIDEELRSRAAVVCGDRSVKPSVSLYTAGASCEVTVDEDRMPLLVELGESLGYVLGFYLAGGRLVKEERGVAFSVKSSEALERLTESLKSLGLPDSILEVRRSAGSDGILLVARSTLLAELLRGTLPRQVGGREVPLDIALRAGRGFRAGLLKGLLDGSLSVQVVEGCRVELIVVGRRLAESLLVLLKSLGVEASVDAPPPGDLVPSSSAYTLRFTFPADGWCSETGPGDTAQTLESGVRGVKPVRVAHVEVVHGGSQVLYDIEVLPTHIYAVSGGLFLTHNTTFHAGSPEEALVRLTSPPIDLSPHQVSMIWLIVTLGFVKDGGLKRAVIRVDEPVMKLGTLVLNTIYRYGEEVDLETLLSRVTRLRNAEAGVP